VRAAWRLVSTLVFEVAPHSKNIATTHCFKRESCFA
jgi:hypothetical protein